jgi:hypothetical protein
MHPVGSRGFLLPGTPQTADFVSVARYVPNRAKVVLTTPREGHGLGR